MFYKILIQFLKQKVVEISKAIYYFIIIILIVSFTIFLLVGFGWAIRFILPPFFKQFDSAEIMMVVILLVVVSGFMFYAIKDFIGWIRDNWTKATRIVKEKELRNE